MANLPDSPLPDSDHIFRYCKKSQLDDDGLPSATAFMRRPPDEEYASVNWLEMLEGNTLDEQLSKLKEIFNSKNFQLKPNAKFALLNVGATISQTKAILPDFNLPILYKPTVKNNVVIDNTHSGIYNLPFPDEDATVAELVAMSMISVHHI
jgi:hypothetical protein